MSLPLSVTRKAPSESWWALGLTREQFDARAKREFETRMVLQGANAAASYLESVHQGRMSAPTRTRGARNEFWCCACGSGDRLEVDHVIPFSRGGKHDISNFQTLCKPCNVRKGART